ncbi:hypothetical protein SH2C18_51150 [Clostridium sediminicola]
MCEEVESVKVVVILGKGFSVGIGLFYKNLKSGGSFYLNNTF